MPAAASRATTTTTTGGQLGGEDAAALFDALHSNVVSFSNDLDSGLRGLASQAVSVRELLDKLEHQKQILGTLPPLNLVVVGATKAGKSTLVNGMLSFAGFKKPEDFYEVLPRRLLAETNAFWRVETSPDACFEFEYENDHKKFDRFSDLATYIQNHYGRGSVKTNSMVFIRVPRLFTSVCGGDFCLIDSPGLSEAGFPHNVHEFLQNNPHILIYVLPLTAGCLTTIDDAFLTEIFKCSKMQKSSTCVFVLTCYDRALGETDKDEVRRSVEELSARIDESFGAKTFPVSCLVLQRGTFNPAFSIDEAKQQLGELLKYIQREFLRNSRLVVLKSIFAALQDIGYDAYNACLSYHKVQYKVIQTQRMFSLFEQLETLKNGMVDTFRQCLEGILQPPPRQNSASHHQKPTKKSAGSGTGGTAAGSGGGGGSPVSNLREHVEQQILVITSTMGFRSKVAGFTSIFKKDFWDRNSYQNKILEHLRPSIRAYIVCALEDVLRSICISFLQLCRAEILENARQSLDSETFEDLSRALNNLTQINKSQSASRQLADALRSEDAKMIEIAKTAVDKVASQATARALYVVAKFNPVWQRSAAAMKVAEAVTEQLGANSAHFFQETRDIAQRLLDDLVRAIKVGVQDYYRTINAAVVLQQHPQLRSLHLLLESSKGISASITRLTDVLLGQQLPFDEVAETTDADQPDEKEAESSQDYICKEINQKENETDANDSAHIKDSDDRMNAASPSGKDMQTSAEEREHSAETVNIEPLINAGFVNEGNEKGSPDHNQAVPLNGQSSEDDDDPNSEVSV